MVQRRIGAGCGAVDRAPPGIPALGILDTGDGGNPAAEFDVGYLPYCDGSLFTGDGDADGDGDGTNDRFFRGLQNLSASLDVIAGRFPAPSRILLIGNSAGGMGVHFALPLVRALYPEVAIEFVNDSGVGISQPGVQEELNAYWSSSAFFPESCTDCIGEDGHLTGYHRFQLEQDENTRMSFLSSRQDEVIVESLGIDGEVFEADMIEAMAELKQAHPERFNSFVVGDDSHTYVLRDFDRAVADISVRQWITDMLEGAEAWVSVSE